MKAECYKFYVEDILESNQVDDIDKGCYTFSFFNHKIKVTKYIILENKCVYLHIIRNDNNDIDEIFIEPNKRWEFQLIETK